MFWKRLITTKLENISIVLKTIENKPIFLNVIESY